jgi:hypothetical protein
VSYREGGVNRCIESGGLMDSYIDMVGLIGVICHMSYVIPSLHRVQ